MYDQASLTTGMTAATHEITIDIAGASTSQHIVIDTTNDIGYISDGLSQCIYVVDGISTADGQITPSRTIIINTGELVGAGGLALHNNTLYVAHLSGINPGGVTVINNASTADGVVTAARHITGASTQLVDPVSITLDVSRNMMYVANQTANKVCAFKNFQTIDGDVAPEYWLEGAATQLSAPSGLFVDTTRDN